MFYVSDEDLWMDDEEEDDSEPDFETLEFPPGYNTILKCWRFSHTSTSPIVTPPLLVRVTKMTMALPLSTAPVRYLAMTQRSILIVAHGGGASVMGSATQMEGEGEYYMYVVSIHATNIDCFIIL